MSDPRSIKYSSQHRKNAITITGPLCHQFISYATTLYQHPSAMWIDLVVHSLSKYRVGHKVK